MKKFISSIALASFGLFAAAAHAAGVAAVDVGDAVESLENQIPSMTSILLAVLGLTAVVMAFRWIKRTMGS